MGKCTGDKIYGNSHVLQQKTEYLVTIEDQDYLRRGL